MALFNSFNFTLVTLLTVLLVTDTAFARVTPAPCSPYNGRTMAVYRRCSDVLNENIVIPPSTVPTLGVLPSIERDTKKYIDSLYENKKTQVLDAAGRPTSEFRYAAPFSLGTVCNIQAAAFNQHPPDPDIQAACGEWMKLNVTYESGVRTIGMDYEHIAPSGMKYGSREMAYIRGGFIKALDCKWRQVTNEITQLGGLKTLTPNCMLGALNTPSLYLNLRRFQLQMESLSAENRSDQEMLACSDASWLKTRTARNAATTDADVRQSSQNLCTMRSTMESLFKQLALCEIIDRAETAYSTVLAAGTEGFLLDIKTDFMLGEAEKICYQNGISTDPADLQTTCLRGAVTTTCTETWYGIIDGCTSSTDQARVDSCVAGGLQAAMNVCYPVYVKEKLKEKFAVFDEASPECQ